MRPLRRVDPRERGWLLLRPPETLDAAERAAMEEVRAEVEARVERAFA
ncbi:MAG TPA: hypothetical protein VGP33_07835 [Chloroflexota bacterium]|jgi:hypothetical protein|nr:hypothetical protein [Chloroflexota bacterium]